VWLAARDPRGLPLPWAYVRRRIALAYGVWPPSLVDAWPIDDLLTELRIMQIEAEAAPRGGAHG
jgi:hypothetical protein